MRRRASAFTLVELLVVVTLMTIAVGMAALRLDGLTASGRLQSAGAQIGALVRLTQSHAQTSGTPRMVEYLIHQDRVVVRSAIEQHGTWAWDEGREYNTGTKVSIERVLVEGEQDWDGSSSRCAIRVGADGRFRAHVVIISVGERYAVTILRSLQQPSCVLLDRPPQAVTFELLTMELQYAQDAS